MWSDTATANGMCGAVRLDHRTHVDVVFVPLPSKPSSSGVAPTNWYSRKMRPPALLDEFVERVRRSAAV